MSAERSAETALLPGHTLRSEGAAFVVNERQKVVRANSHQGTGGYGRGLCSCGALSDLLGSGYQRKAWHRAHKAALRTPPGQERPA